MTMTTTMHASSANTATTPPNSQGNSHISPAHSARTTPTNVSPSSPHPSSTLPHFPLATRQLRPPKLPLYVPAVLRPTERAHRPSPLTPPRSMHGSTDSLDGGGGGGGAQRPRSRRSTAESQHHNHHTPHRKRVPTEPSAERSSASPHPSHHSPPTSTFSEVQGLPTRAHWKPDAHAIMCDAPTCHKSFNLFERRHHCRHCGHVFCNTDSHYAVPLDHRAEFHPDGNLSRACQDCWDRYCRWKMGPALGGDGGEAHGGDHDTGSATTPTSPVAGNHEPGGRGVGRRIGGRGGRGGREEMPKSAVAGSAPRDWSWSTF